MKSCHIVPSLEARHGGPSKSVVGLAKALADRGEPVELLTTEPGRGWSEFDGNLEIRAFHRGWPRALCGSRGLRSHLAELSADIIHHHSIWLRTLHYAHETAKRLKTPFVVSPRGMMEPWAWRHHSKRKSFARAVIHPKAFEDVDGWHATSEAEAEGIRALGMDQPICVAPNGVTMPSAAAIQDAAKFWHEFEPATAKRPIAIFYSRFHRKKRLLELVDAWLEFGPPDWLLLVVGIPEDYTPRMIENYVLRCSQAGRVRAYDGADLPPPYAVASLFLLPSHSENFGLSVAEALAHGVPALVTDTTPWSGLNKNGGGWCVPWSAFPKTIREATAEGPDALRRRGSIGRGWVANEFSWEKSARSLYEFYSGLRTGLVSRVQ